jgi:hypothetical protein
MVKRSMWPLALVAIVLIAVILVAAVEANLNNGKYSSNATFWGLDLSDYRTWILKSVCEDDATKQLLAWDPYSACPTGSTLRKTAVGDKIVYNNYEQMGNQISDSFAIMDASGNAMYLHNFDYFPFNQFNQHSGSDGYDIYSIDSSTVSYSNTKDGGGYGSTFYGDKCQFGGGWVLFPTTNFLKDSQGFWPISGVYWEQSGQNQPGDCPSGYSRNTLTLWEQKPSFAFGGMNGNAAKPMDTIVSYHGYETDDGTTPTSNFLANGHLEVFYFTVQYGITRWEVWAVPGSEYSVKGRKNMMTECSGSSTQTFKSQTFEIIACHDWSNVKVLDSPVVPVWPVVNANLLSHFHFDSDLSDKPSGMGVWYRFGTSPAGNLINWSILTSTASSDANNGAGMKYLALNCGAGSDGKCGDSGTQAIYQDIPAKTLCSGCGVMFGVNARTASGTGCLSIALQVLDTSNNVQWQEVTTDCIAADNGDGRGTEAQSVYLSSKFFYKLTVLPSYSLANTSAVRFLMLPNDAATFYVVDAFVNRYPVYN